MAKKSEKQASIKQVLSEGAFHGTNYSPDDIKNFLRRDIKGVYILLAEVLQSDEVIDALASVYYKRYQELMAQQPIEFNEPQENGRG